MNYLRFAGLDVTPKPSRADQLVWLRRRTPVTTCAAHFVAQELRVLDALVTYNKTPLVR